MRTPEQDIDLSLFEGMDEQEAIAYVTGKYSEEVADAIALLLNKQ